MFNISTYLKKITKTIDGNTLVMGDVTSVIQKHTSITIPLNKIEIKNNIVYINTSVFAKNRIFLVKNTLLEELKGYSIVDIR